MDDVVREIIREFNISDKFAKIVYRNLIMISLDLYDIIHKSQDKPK